MKSVTEVTSCGMHEPSSIHHPRHDTSASRSAELPALNMGVQMIRIPSGPSVPSCICWDSSVLAHVNYSSGKWKHLLKTLT